MTRLRVSIALLGMSPVLVACGSSDTSAQPQDPVTVTQTVESTPSSDPTEASTEPTPKATPPSPVEATVDPAAALATLKRVAPRFKQVTNAEIDAFAKEVCLSIVRTGGSLARADRANLSAGMTSKESVAIIVYSVMTACPQFESDLGGWVGSM